MRTLLIFIALVLIVMIGRQLLRRPRRTPRTPGLDGRMVQCAHCGVFVPEHEALARDGRFYCSREHRDQLQDPDDSA
jgi:uncharacterized protein